MKEGKKRKRTLLRTFNNTNNNNTKQIGSNDDKQCRIHRDNTTKKKKIYLLLNPRAKESMKKKKKTETCEASKNRHFFFFFASFFFFFVGIKIKHTHTQNRTNFSVLRLKKKKNWQILSPTTAFRCGFIRSRVNFRGNRKFRLFFSSFPDAISREYSVAEVLQNRFSPRSLSWFWS